MKRLDEKLERVRNGSYTPKDFIIADAKDADMGFGLTAPGPRRGGGYKSRSEYLQNMRDMVASDLVDVMLMSVSSAEVLVGDGTLEGTPVTPAVRLNDSTDIWSQRHGTYKEGPARPFRTADLGRAEAVSDLGLYAITFCNDLEYDHATLESYAEFREELADTGLRHFLEVFNPAFDIGMASEDLAFYLNDCIVRTLAGVASADRPLFLKAVYNGPRALEELAAYDPSGLIVGILGGGKGTTRDTFELVRQAEKYGGRVALFGRKINLAESPTTLVSLMRRVVEGEASSEEAVRAYHGELQAQDIEPTLPLESDLEITEAILKGN